ncbi:hypothetical protein EVA_05397 [gut metagenome]|uniref:Uncharacterized protein n=1 Tax=gut metagenome TaxID=749906 RepID=J9GUK7_9ZZZZ
MSSQGNKPLSIRKSICFSCKIRISMIKPYRRPTFVYFQRSTCRAAGVGSNHHPTGYSQHFVCMLFHHILGDDRQFLYIINRFYIFLLNACLCI